MGGLPPAKGHVLVVDDHAALAENLREILTADDSLAEVTVLGSGQRALEHARTRGFDVAIVDVKLPDGSGVDLLPALREMKPGAILLADGFSCRTQASQLGAVEGFHLAQVIAQHR